MDKKHKYFDGRKFTRDDKTGYYLCSTPSEDGRRKRMHVYVWEYYNGPVPQGFHVHHIDGDKGNNDIENLTIIDGTKHRQLHSEQLTPEQREWRRINLRENAAPKAKSWHTSMEGKQWHKEHYVRTKEKLRERKCYTCECCGKNFESTQITVRFCSNNCRSKYRRMSGVDNITKICEDCGGEYVANKYAKTKYCSLCKNKKHTRRRKS